MFKTILLLTGAISLVSSSHAVTLRDQAARTFGHQLDSLNEQYQDNNDNQDDQQENDENNQTQEQDNDGNQSQEGNELTPEQQLSDLSEDMKSVMLHIDRLDRKIAKLEEAAAAHKKVANDKKNT